MTKEAKQYVKNVMRGKGFLIDFISAALSVGILIMVIVNSIGVFTGMYFVEIFAFGALLAFLNCIKKVRSKSSFALAYGMFGVLMIVASVISYVRN